jgi:hypothetical protein
MERVEETTKEACSLFLKKFTVAYRDALFVRAKLDYGIAPSATSELVSSPKHSYVLKRGKLYKRGGNVSFLVIFLFFNNINNCFCTDKELETSIFYSSE